MQNHISLLFFLYLLTRNSIPTMRKSTPIIMYITDRNIFLEPNKLAVDSTKYLEEPKALMS
jgi:hypothetical protein